MSNILCIDASTEACSVALKKGDKIFERYQLAPRQHAALVLPLVESLLEEGELNLQALDAIACCVGPGAFTGLRIAVAAAQGLAYAANLKAIPVSSLANMASLGASTAKAENKSISEQWISAIDARMGEVYLGAYRVDGQGIATALIEEQVIAPDAIDWSLMAQCLDLSVINSIGSGFQAFPEQLLSKVQPRLLHADGFPSARYSLAQAQAALTAGELVEPEALQPVYLRNNVAVKKQAKTSL